MLGVTPNGRETLAGNPGANTSRKGRGVRRGRRSVEADHGRQRLRSVQAGGGAVKLAHHGADDGGQPLSASARRRRAAGRRSAADGVCTLRLPRADGPGARHRPCRVAGPDGLCARHARSRCRRRRARCACGLGRRCSWGRAVPAIAFEPKRDLLWEGFTRLPRHPNALRFSAFDASGATFDAMTYFSVGGGFVCDELEMDANDRSAPAEEMPIPHPFTSGAELLATAEASGLTIAGVMMANELAHRPQAADRGQVSTPSSRPWSAASTEAWPSTASCPAA